MHRTSQIKFTNKKLIECYACIVVFVGIYGVVINKDENTKQILKSLTVPYIYNI